jgi:hypothetical protein
VKYISLVILSCVLSGCATLGTSTEVKIPIAVACKTEDPLQPTYRYVPPYDNIFDAVRDLLGDRELAVAYENELRTALKSCK